MQLSKYNKIFGNSVNFSGLFSWQKSCTIFIKPKNLQLWQQKKQINGG